MKNSDLEKFISTKYKNYDEIYKNAMKSFMSSVGYVDSYKLYSYTDIIKDTSYMMYPFNDIRIKEEYTTGKNLGVTSNNKSEDSVNYVYKDISPLFIKDVLNEKLNLKILDILMEDIPYYYIEPDYKYTEEDVLNGLEILSETRDPGVNDVPEPLKTSYWSVWFRNAWGDIQNNVILDIYNKIRYPFINENNYLNASILPRITENIIGENLEEYDNNEIISYDLGLNDINGYDDYLNDITDNKLKSIYRMLDYKPDYSDLLKYWGESLYLSGRIDKEELDNQKEVYKLQDLKYELLRRKFAGSLSLYNITLSSIDRQGSFINLLSVGDLSTSSIFKDKRPLRIVNIPGILTKTTDLSSMNPIKNLYSIPYSENKDYIPLDIVNSLYYTSSSQNNNYYSAVTFYLGEKERVEEYEVTLNKTSLQEPSSTIRVKRYVTDMSSSPESLLNYRNSFLKDNNKVLNLDSLDTINTFKSINSIYRTLDERRLSEDKSYEYITLDGKITKYDENGNYESIDITLDMSEPLFNYTSISGNAFDITANKILYHKNSIQSSLESSYPYLTYPISGGNSVSLMDSYWIDYIENATINKSRVQDNIQYGTQISLLSDESNIYCSHKQVFCYSFGNNISYSDDIKDFNNSSSTNNFSYVYLWYCDITYDDNTFKVIDFTKKLVSKIALKINENTINDSVKSALESFSSYKLQTIGNIGVLPFTYDYLTEDMIKSIKLGLVQSNTEYKYYDDATENNLAVAFFGFSDYDINGNYFISSIDVSKPYDDSVIHQEFTKDTKCVYYAVSRLSDVSYTIDTYIKEHGNIEYEEALRAINLEVEKGTIIKEIIDGEPYYTERKLYWSSPVRIEPLSNYIRFNDSFFYPEWKGLSYYLNPYLNFTGESASPLRHHELKSLSQPVSYNNNGEFNINESSSYSITDNTILCNLTRMRNLGALCNDDGSSTGMYLLRDYDIVSELSLNPSKVINKVYGDNRYHSLLNPNENLDKVFRDNLSSPCIKISTGGYFVDEEKISYGNSYTNVYKDRYLIVPNKSQNYEGWYWNNRENSDGISIFSNISLDSEYYSHINNSRILIAKREEEFKLYLTEVKSNLENKKITFKVSFSYGGESYVTAEPIEVSSSSNIRIGASVYRYEETIIHNSNITYVPHTKISICVNNYIVYSNKTNGDSAVSLVSVINNNNPIELFSEVTTDEHTSVNTVSNILFGNIYDLRLYKKGFDTYQMINLSAGTMWEKYSYSPSIYKLGYSIYKNLGIVKKVFNGEVEVGKMLPEITSIRMFNRSVWDSILIDEYKVSDEETKIGNFQYKQDSSDPKDDVDIYKYVNGNYVFNECIEQILDPNAEIKNNISTLEGNSSIKVCYNGNIKELPSDTVFDLVTTMLEPVQYKDSLFSSQGNNSSLVEWDKNNSTLRISSIHIPSIDSSNTLEYKADMSLTFDPNYKMNLTDYYSKGLNIQEKYIEEINGYAITLKDKSIKSSYQNYVYIPMYIPKMEINGEYPSNILIDRLLVENIGISDYIKTFLKVENYYTEVEFPIYNELIHNYVSKWDGIRTLKEGAYYITCKYPVQILPFNDSDYNDAIRDTVITLYGTVRFKILVSGTPLSHDDYDIRINDSAKESYTSNKLYVYNSDRISSSLYQGKSIYNPLDNRTYPHRQINIDLFVEDCIQPNMGVMGTNNSEVYEPIWTKIASNHSIDSTKGEILLDKEALKNPIILNRSVPMFLSKSYNTPMYMSKIEKDSSGNLYFDPASSDDDLIDPIEILPILNSSNIEKETKGISGESDLDNIKLVAGRPYTLLFDYTGNITELSYTDESACCNPTENKVSEEQPCYVKMSNLLDRSNVEDFIYTGDCPWYNISAYDPIHSKTTGYNILNNEFTSVSSTDARHEFGNPYSKSSSKNALIEKYGYLFRREIEESCFIPYMIYLSESERSLSGILPSTYLTRVNTVTDILGDIIVSRYLEIDEHEILLKIRETIYNNIISSIIYTTNSGNGIFSFIQKLYPSLKSINTKSSISISPIRDTSYDLGYYSFNYRTVRSRNTDITISRKSTYSNNKIVNQNFDDYQYWNKNIIGEYIDFPGYKNGKDIYTVKIPAKDYFKIESLENILWDKSSYEIAISLHTGNDSEEDYKDIDVYACLINRQNGSTTKELNKDNTDESAEVYDKMFQLTRSDNVYSIDTPQFEATSVMFVIVNNSEAEISVSINKVIVRSSNVISHTLGLSNVVYAPSNNNPIIIGNYNVVFFYGKTSKTSNSIIPVQFNTSTNGSVSLDNSSSTDKKNVYNYKSSQSLTYEFIENNSINVVSNPNTILGFDRFNVLIKPWIRQIHYVRKTGKVKFYKYEIRKDELGANISEISGIPVYDIYGIKNSLGTWSYNSITGLSASGIKVNFEKNNKFTMYGLDLLLNDNPVILNNEKFSLVSNCFNSDKYLNGESNMVSVTNIQLLGNLGYSSENNLILYEIEYLPIIYDENKNHISFNMILYSDRHLN